MTCSPTWIACACERDAFAAVAVGCSCRSWSIYSASQRVAFGTGLLRAVGCLVRTPGASLVPVHHDAAPRAAERRRRRGEGSGEREAQREEEEAEHLCGVRCVRKVNGNLWEHLRSARRTSLENNRGESVGAISHQLFHSLVIIEKKYVGAVRWSVRG